MLRRIVVIRPHEPLHEGWTKRSFGVSGIFLNTAIKVAGQQFHEDYHPVRMLGQITARPDRRAALGFNYQKSRAQETFCLRSDFDDEEAIERFRHDRRDEVVGVYADPSVTTFPSVYCGNKAVGDVHDVAAKLGVRSLHKAGLTGRKVAVAVVDTGIDASRVPVSGGWSPDGHYIPGSAGPDHGTMVGFDVRISAPDCQILDYALLRRDVGSWTAFLSDAIAAFANLMVFLDQNNQPLVVNNSWGMFDRSEDAPIGSPENYSANPEHPFNQIVGSLVDAGADVFFAAGNCGKDCPDGRCGAHDVGPGASIHGANSHPDAITVAAVTVTDKRLGYSSQGPGGLYARKPDIAAYSHFKGSGIDAADGGTSAASPVAAGVAAALRQKFSRTKLKPAQLKGILQRTACDLGGDGWDYDLGYGVVDAAAAMAALKVSTTKTKKKSKAKTKKSSKKKARA